jgi:hypothetical protein
MKKDILKSLKQEAMMDEAIASASFLQVGRTQQCGHCNPKEFGEGLKQAIKAGVIRCDCVCHDKPIEGGWEDSFCEKFVRTDLSKEERGKMKNWFLVDYIVAQDMIDFIATQISEAYDRGMEFQDSIWQKTHTELVKEAKKEGHDEAVEKVKGRIGFLRQWLNERPSDFIVTNEVIEAWLLEASPLDEIK